MAAWFSPAEVTAIGLSLKVAVVAALASLPFGVAVAWLLARRRFPGKALLDALVHLPLVLPPVVMGYALLVMFGNQGPLGRWLHDTLGITLAFSVMPGVFALLKAAALWVYPLHGQEVQRIERELSERRAALA